MAQYAKIIIDVAHAAVNKPFTYLIPENLCVLPGHHVYVPFGSGNKKKEGFVVAVFSPSEVDAADIPENCKEIHSLIEPYTLFTQDQLSLARWMCENYNCLWIDALRCMIPAQIRGGRIKEKTETVYSVKDIGKAESLLPFMRSSLQKSILAHLLDTEEHAAGRAELQSLFPQPGQALAALVKKGLMVTDTRTVLRHPGSGLPAAEKPVLTGEQEKAISDFRQLPSGAAALLFGVTGSGKTEVYLRLIEDCLRADRSAIVLVPEISLTPQTVGRFSARFEDKIAVLHSALTPGERFDEWRRIRNGEAPIVIGARSAVFAPVHNLSLIVIDEEQETSYQSETVPRYSALEIARKRITDCGGKLLLGSATPSLLSYYRASSGAYSLLTLTDRVWNRPMPAVHIVDMRSEFLSGNTGIFSAPLVAGLKKCLSRGRQAMLLINRRGYSTFISCRSCGYVFKCSCCDISMTYHKAENRMRCHYCGSVQKLPEECPNCRKPFIKQFGIGTEQVEEQLKALFPSVQALRMDTDTVRGRTGMRRFSAHLPPARRRYSSAPR